MLQKVPTKHDLLNVQADITYSWYELGLSLRVQRSLLDHLSQSAESNMVKLVEVLTIWMDTMSRPVT